MQNIFYLGTHRPHWLALLEIPLFVSRRQLFRRRSLPRARARWALDSGGFSELEMHGGWTVSPRAYVAEVRRFDQEIGLLDFAAPQDWMCEPWILRRTGLSVGDHQRRTVYNYLRLLDLAPDLPWIPVLQGWTTGDYCRHAEMYAAAGVQLARLSRVGVGTLCRRQGTVATATILAALTTEHGLRRLHGFGVKKAGLRRGLPLISADSLAWSFGARYSPPLPGCTHRACSGCARYALRWRSGLPQQWL